LSDSAAPPATLSRRPYLLRAMHEWMADNGYTPHVIVDARREGVNVPTAYIKDDRIVLNVSVSATQHLQLRNEQVEFDARFGGVVHHVVVPLAAVLGIYARETGEGMVFNDVEPESPPPEQGGAAPEAADGKLVSGGKTRRAKLTVVK
jgi:stringent starvation protein B